MKRLDLCLTFAWGSEFFSIFYRPDLYKLAICQRYWLSNHNYISPRQNPRQLLSFVTSFLKLPTYYLVLLKLCDCWAILCMKVPHWEWMLPRSVDSCWLCNWKVVFFHKWLMNGCAFFAKSKKRKNLKGPGKIYTKIILKFWCWNFAPSPFFLKAEYRYCRLRGILRSCFFIKHLFFFCVPDRNGLKGPMTNYCAKLFVWEIWGVTGQAWALCAMPACTLL